MVVFEVATEVAAASDGTSLVLCKDGPTEGRLRTRLDGIDLDPESISLLRFEAPNRPDEA